MGHYLLDEVDQEYVDEGRSECTKRITSYAPFQLADEELG